VEAQHAAAHLMVVPLLDVVTHDGCDGSNIRPLLPSKYVPAAARNGQAILPLHCCNGRLNLLGVGGSSCPAATAHKAHRPSGPATQ